MRRKLTKSLISIITAIACASMIITFFPKKAYAGGVEIGVSSDYIEIGEAVTVTVTLYGSEIYAYSGYISCDGNLSGEVGDFADAADGQESVSISFTYRAVGEGTGSVYVSDCSVSDGVTKDDCGGAACTITVYSNENAGGGTGGNAGSDDYKVDGGFVNGNETKEGSSDCALSSLTVEGYELKDEGHDSYSLSVGASVDKIKILATPNDEKATVEGAGEHSLNVGENRFEVLVTAENGFSKSYVITVTRKGDKIALADLINELSTTKEDAVTIELKDGDKLTLDMIKAIQKWGKTLILNKYAEDGKVVYGWTLEGKNMGTLKEFDPEVTFESKTPEKMDEASNFTKGKVLNFAHSGELPKGTKFSLNVAGDFKKDDVVRLYYYDEKSNSLTQEGDIITVGDDIVNFEIKHCSEYFLTRAKLGQVKEVKVNTKKEKIMLFAIIMELAIIIALVVFIIITLKNKKNNNNRHRDKRIKVTDIDDDELEEIDYQDL